MMKNFILLYAVDKNWNIGNEGGLLYKISEDLKRFKKLSTGNIIIMGRKTFESLPNSKALPNRINIVITRNKDYKAENVYVVNSIDELFDLIKELNPNDEMENLVIGGGDIGRKLLPHSNRAYLTKIYRAFDEADTSFPNLDEDSDWKIEKESEIHLQDDVEYKYVNYVRIK